MMVQAMPGNGETRNYMPQNSARTMSTMDCMSERQKWNRRNIAMKSVQKNNQSVAFSNHIP